MELHTSPPQALPLPKQSLSLLQVLPSVRGPPPPPPLEAFTLPPPARLLTRPILLVDSSVNQMLPSGPDVMPVGSLPAVGIEYSATVPSVATRPVELMLPA